MYKILYHGAIYVFNDINVNKGKPFKDFDNGFYATSVKQHADRIALRNKRYTLRMLSRANKVSNIIPYRYEMTFNENFDGLNVKEFKEANIEWVKFIIFNRLSRTGHKYDIVIGPTADERTTTIIESYIDVLKSNATDEVYNRIIKELKPENLPKQYLFATERAVKQTLTHNANWRKTVKAR